MRKQLMTSETWWSSKKSIGRRE